MPTPASDHHPTGCRRTLAPRPVSRQAVARRAAMLAAAAVAAGALGADALRAQTAPAAAVVAPAPPDASASPDGTDFRDAVRAAEDGLRHAAAADRSGPGARRDDARRLAATAAIRGAVFVDGVLAPAESLATAAADRLRGAVAAAAVPTRAAPSSLAARTGTVVARTASYTSVALSLAGVGAMVGGGGAKLGSSLALASSVSTAVGTLATLRSTARPTASALGASALGGPVRPSSVPTAPGAPAGLAVVPPAPGAVVAVLRLEVGAAARALGETRRALDDVRRSPPERPAGADSALAAWQGAAPRAAALLDGPLPRLQSLLRTAIDDSLTPAPLRDVLAPLGDALLRLERGWRDERGTVARAGAVATAASALPR